MEMLYWATMVVIITWILMSWLVRKVKQLLDLCQSISERVESLSSFSALRVTRIEDALLKKREKMPTIYRDKERSQKVLDQRKMRGRVVRPLEDGERTYSDMPRFDDGDSTGRPAGRGDGE
jgi:hypothetical protein